MSMAVHLPLEQVMHDALLCCPTSLRPWCCTACRGRDRAWPLQWLRQMGYTQATNGGSVGAVALQTGRGIRRL